MTSPIIVETSRFYALDDIPGTAVQRVSPDEDGKQGTFFLFLKDEKDTFFEPANSFGMFVEIQ